jgi:hypothetical protein
MANATRLTNLEVKGLDVKGTAKLGITKATYKTTKSDGAAAAGTAPTKAEYDAVVALVNDLKAKYNALVTALADGE